jgi:hypothetical protein
MASEHAEDYVGYERLERADEMLKMFSSHATQRAIANALIDIAYSLKGIRQDQDRMTQGAARETQRQ